MLSFFSSILLCTSICLDHFATAIPTAPAPSSSSAPVFYNWSTSPLCASNTTKPDCTSAVAAVCANQNLTQSIKKTQGGCTAWYWVDAGNTIPTAAECTASYSQVLASSNAFGAVGYNAAQTRTNDPLYAVYPSNGNGNCFKAMGDTSPVLPMDALPNGNASLAECGAKTKRDLGVAKCFIEDGAWQIFCNGVCMAQVAATSWLTGPLGLAGGLACLGGCDFVGAKVAQRCFDALDEGEGTKVKRASPVASTNKCLNIQRWTFECPAWEEGLKAEYGCDSEIMSGGNGQSLVVT